MADIDLHWPDDNEAYTYGHLPQEPRYSRSTIKFPYTSLKDAERLASVLHACGGDATFEQLAEGLDASPTSGAFRIKVATARTFGAITPLQRHLTVTPLGRRLIDPQTRPEARVEAFMRVPLFAALAEDYKDVPLPPDPVLERRIHELGVSTKLVSRARQAFQRSAQLAGLLRDGRRLGTPVEARESLEADHSRPDEDWEQRGCPAASALPTALIDLWVTLLDEGSSWPPEKIGEYLDTARKLRKLLAADG
jgi:hypothetical protein